MYIPMEAIEPQAKKPWTYDTDRVVLVPITDSTAHILGVDILAKLWARTERDRLFPICFSGMGDMNFARFIAYFQPLPVLVGLSKPPVQAPEDVKRQQGSEIAGYAWLNGVEGAGEFKKALVNFVLFRPFWRTSDIRDLAHLSLRWWFEELRIGVLYGTIRRDNPFACNFARHFGFRKLTVLPKFHCRPDGFDDAVLVVLTREQYLETLASGKEL